jgi:CDP-glucose 4,6-dehydratase
LRHLDNTCVGIFVTTDKVYENREEGLPFTEADRLGGHDPYSASKAMAELAITAYTKSFFDSSDCRVKISSVRAGNVIGGGDWALDRVLPDCIRALRKNESIQIRNPNATRPWQHVLEPLSGYLWLAYELATNSGVPHALNFGPPPDCSRPVRDVVTEVLRNWPGTWTDHSSPNALHEARLLSLSIDKAVGRGWMPVWNFEETIRQTVEWYRSVSLDPLRSREVTLAQIKAYATHASFAGLRWAKE